jgi:hypothetical protein
LTTWSRFDHRFMSEMHRATGLRDPSFLASLRVLADDPSRARIPIADMLSLVPDRALLGMILLFSVPNMLPMPPGTSAILGAPLVILALQWAFGLRAWLPPRITRVSIARSDVQRLVGRVEPWLTRAEGVLRPRFAPILNPWWERLASAVCVMLALILVLPIPLGNMPPAFAISMLALGFLRRDGLWVLAGIVTAFASIAVVFEVVWTLATGFGR